MYLNQMQGDSYNNSPPEFNNSKNTGTSNPKRTRITRACKVIHNIEQKRVKASHVFFYI